MKIALSLLALPLLALSAPAASAAQKLSPGRSRRKPGQHVLFSVRSQLSDHGHGQGRPGQSPGIPRRQRRRFEAMDADKDGYVTRDEIRLARDKAREQRERLREAREQRRRSGSSCCCSTSSCWSWDASWKPSPS